MSASMFPSMLLDMLITRRRIEKIRFTHPEPADRDPSDPKQDSNYTNEEYLQEFDHQLSQPLRDPQSIFSKSALQQERSRNASKVTDPNIENTFTAQQNAVENPSLARSKRNLRPTKKYVKYRSNQKERSHLSINQINANSTKLISDPELQIQIDTTDTLLSAF